MAKKCISAVLSTVVGEVSFEKNSSFTLKLSNTTKILNGCMDESMVSGTDGVDIDVDNTPRPYGYDPKFPNSSGGSFIVKMKKVKVCRDECCGQQIMINSSQSSKTITANSDSNSIDVNEIVDSFTKWVIEQFGYLGLDEWVLKSIILILVSNFNFKDGWLATKSDSKEVGNRLEQIFYKIYLRLQDYANCLDAINVCYCNEVSYDKTYKHPSIITFETNYPELSLNQTILTNNLTTI